MPAQAARLKEPGILREGPLRRARRASVGAQVLGYPMARRDPCHARYSTNHDSPRHTRARGQPPCTLVKEVQSAIAQHQVVVVGMAQNPFPRKARKALDAAGVATTT